MRRGLLLGGILVLALVCFGAGWATVRLSDGAVTAAVVATTAPSVTALPDAPPAPPAGLGDARALLLAEQEWLRQLYTTASPSVVNITSRSYSYDFFFNVVPQEGAGSGFLWDGQGHIVTNYHVIAGAQELEVRFADGSQRSATVVGSDPANDLAVLRVEQEGEANSLPPALPLGNDAALSVGQRVIAIGNPFGFEQTLTSGIVSALGRVIQSETGDFIGEVVQHDAAINPGNSGGPLLDLDGRVIGVNTQIVSPSGASAGIGFAIPANTVARVVPELIARGRYPHPWLGVQGFDLTPGFAERLRRANLPPDADEGVLVVGVYRGGPAVGILRGGDHQVRAGNLLLPIGGDLIVALDGQPIPDQRAMLLYLEGNKRVGDSVRVQFWRDGQLQEADMTLTERPGAAERR